MDVRKDIAIVVPCYNAERTLASTLESAIAQGNDVEVVVIDDGSTDGSLALARTFEPRVRVLTGPNRGVSAARNRGIAETRAGWIVFLDSDDLLLAGTLALRFACAEATRADVIVCDWQEISGFPDADAPAQAIRSIDWVAMKDDAELATATEVWATTAAIMYRRALVERIGGFRQDLPVIQDARFLFDAMLCGGKAAHSVHVGACYRIAPSSLSRRSAARFWEDVLRNGQQIESLWRAAGTLRDRRLAAVRGIYNMAARGLFSAAHPAYFEAHAALRALGLPEPLHGRVAAPLARAVGLQAARTMLSLVGRA